MDSIKKNISNLHFTFVVVGGGIAGVSCVETLAFLSKDSHILLVANSDIVKAASSVIQITETISEINVEEIQASSISRKFPNVKIITDEVIRLNHADRMIETVKNYRISFDKLCICTGASPNLIQYSNPFIIGIRDTESVLEFQKKIHSARRVMIVGNGGIASEIIYEVKGIDKVWVIKDDYISKTFIDAGAAEFFEGTLEKEGKVSTVVKRMRFTTSGTLNHDEGGSTTTNPALGPDWHKHFDLRGSQKSSELTVEFGTEICEITSGENGWPVRVILTNGKTYNVDFIVSATGVKPNSKIFVVGNESLKIAEDGGIIVDWKMETTLTDVFAAGDVCSAGWEFAPHWHQMRLWTQARQMGIYGAKSMVASLKNETISQDFCFEIFTHVTKLFGYKVILLGLFNGQKLDNEYELLLRITKGKEYVKLVLKNGKLKGALLIGETDLEEMCENLILNQLDLTPYGEDLLNPDIDIEDYFD